MGGSGGARSGGQKMKKRGACGGACLACLPVCRGSTPAAACAYARSRGGGWRLHAHTPVASPQLPLRLLLRAAAAWLGLPQLIILTMVPL